MRGVAELCYATAPVGDDALVTLRAHAFESGRVLERDGLTVLGFGTAAVLQLPGGLTDPSSLGRVARGPCAHLPRLARRERNAGADRDRRTSVRP